MKRHLYSVLTLALAAGLILTLLPTAGLAVPKGEWKITGLAPRLLGKAEKKVCPATVVLNHEYFAVMKNTDDRFILLTNITNPASEDMEGFRDWQATGGDDGLGGSQWVGMLVNEAPLAYPKLAKGQYMISFDADGGLSFYDKRETVKARILPEELEEIEGYFLSNLEYTTLEDKEKVDNLSAREKDHLQLYRLTSSIPRQSYYVSQTDEEGVSADFVDFKLFVPIGDEMLWICGQLKPKPEGDKTWEIVKE